MTTPPEKSVGNSHQCPVCSGKLNADTVMLAHDATCPRCSYRLWCLKKMVDEVSFLHVLPGVIPERADIEHLANSLADSGDTPCVVLDLSRIDAVDSSFLVRLIVLNNRIRASKGRLVLCGLTQHAQHVFGFTKLDAVFEIADDEEAALARL